MTRIRAVFLAIAIVASLSVAGGSYAILSSRNSAEQHLIKCLAAYAAFVQVIGASGSTERLSGCEQSPLGQEPIHLEPRDHPFVVKKYEACLSAHLLMLSDLQTSLALRNQHCSMVRCQSCARGVF
jgi:hypothetical protein